MGIAFAMLGGCMWPLEIARYLAILAGYAVVLLAIASLHLHRSPVTPAAAAN